MQQLRLLIVEDHRDIAENIGDYLSGLGHTVDFAMDGISAMHLALTCEFDCIVLDIMLPGMDGLSFCRKLRQEAGRDTGVLMLTARDTLNDKLEGFRQGADDYLVKPFALPELAARLQALARRGRSRIDKSLIVGDLSLDLGTLQAKRQGQVIQLHPISLKILRRLMEASPNVVTRETLEHDIWGEQLPGSDALRTHVYGLRRAIDKPFSSALLHTVHGIGYRLAVAD